MSAQAFAPAAREMHLRALAQAPFAVAAVAIAVALDGAAVLPALVFVALYAACVLGAMQAWFLRSAIRAAKPLAAAPAPVDTGDVVRRELRSAPVGVFLLASTAAVPPVAGVLVAGPLLWWALAAAVHRWERRRARILLRVPAFRWRRRNGRWGRGVLDPDDFAHAPRLAPSPPARKVRG